MRRSSLCRPSWDVAPDSQEAPSSGGKPPSCSEVFTRALWRPGMKFSPEPGLQGFLGPSAGLPLQPLLPGSARSGA